MNPIFIWAILLTLVAGGIIGGLNYAGKDINPNDLIFNKAKEDSNSTTNTLNFLNQSLGNETNNETIVISGWVCSNFLTRINNIQNSS